MFTLENINNLFTKITGKVPRQVTEYAFNFSADATNLALKLNQYFGKNNEVLYGTISFVPFVSAATPYDFTVKIFGISGESFFDFTYKDSSATTDKFSDFNQALNTFFYDATLTENNGYTNGGLKISFSGFRITY
jgi:hypothetical protein